MMSTGPLPSKSGIELINTGERSGFSSSEHLRNAERQATDRGFDKITIVDVDAHHYEMDHWLEIIKYIEDPIIRHRAETAAQSANAYTSLLHVAPAPQNISGRILRN